MAKIARPASTRPAKQMGPVQILKTQPVASSGQVQVLCIPVPNLKKI